MDVRSVKHRTRSASPARSNGAAMRDPISGTRGLKDGNLFIEDVGVPDVNVQPGGNVNTVMEIGNGASFVAIFDDDYCNPPNIVTRGGYKYEMIVNPAWTGEKRKSGCIATTEVGSFIKSFNPEFVAPSTEGAHEITFRLRTRGTGQTTSTTKTITVRDDGSVDPDPGNGDDGDGGGSCDFDFQCDQGFKCSDGTCVPRDDGGDGGGPLLPCWSDPNNECSPFDFIGYGALGLVLAVALAGR